MIGIYHHTKLLIEMGSCELFTQLASKCKTPNFCFLSTEHHRHEP
jgi:hypothetical protein